VAAVQGLSVEELRCTKVVEEKLRELLRDPDEGLAIRPEIRDHLLNTFTQSSSEAVPAAKVARRLGIEW